MAYHWWNIITFYIHFHTFQIWWTEEGFCYEQFGYFTHNHSEIMNINLRRYQTCISCVCVMSQTVCWLCSDSPDSLLCSDSPDSLPSYIRVHTFVFFSNPVDNLFFQNVNNVFSNSFYNQFYVLSTL